MRVYVHATDLPIIKAHQGIWRFTLLDGSLLCAVGHDDKAFARHLLKTHPAVKSVIPTRASGAAADPALASQVEAFLRAWPGATFKSLPPAAKVDDILGAVYAVTGDPAFAPEGSD